MTGHVDPPSDPQLCGVTRSHALLLQGNLHLLCIIRDSALHKKLDALDTAIRGNGKPGIQLRLDRLEGAQRLRSRIVWLIIGAAITLAASAAWRAIWGTGK